MKQLLGLTFVIGLAIISGCDVPAPPQYDHAMLRKYFGASIVQIVETFGNPSRAMTLAPTDSQDSSGQAQQDAMQWVYSTVDGDLVFHFNKENKVHRITYLDRPVSPTH